MSQGINNALQNILVSYLGMAAQRLTNWIATEVGMTTASAAGAAARATVETTAATTAKVEQAAIGVAGVTASAAEGAAAAYKAMAGIPVIGPALGAIAAVATFTGIMAYKTMIPSAAMGWDIPADSLAYVHKKEMILPEHLSERIRQMTSPVPAAAPAMAQPGNTIHVHYSVQAWDSRDVGKFVRSNGAGMADGLARGAKRNFSGQRIWRRGSGR